ncbi:MAG: Photosystem II reaction center protein I [Gemmatimonadaceae bacterium]|nr:Photosystem II reaction center protein I [Gloeobacterales cyanobacterium ES-bin-141]
MDLLRWVVTIVILLFIGIFTFGFLSGDSNRNPGRRGGS